MGRGKIHGQVSLFIIDVKKGLDNPKLDERNNPQAERCRMAKMNLKNVPKTIIQNLEMNFGVYANVINLIRKTGVISVVKAGGRINTADEIQIIYPAAPHQKLDVV